MVRFGSVGHAKVGSGQAGYGEELWSGLVRRGLARQDLTGQGKELRLGSVGYGRVQVRQDAVWSGPVGFGAELRPGAER